MKNQVTKSRFLSWYISDSDDAYDIGRDVISALKNKGTYTINVKELFDSCGYLPAFICVNNDDGEYEPNEVELING